ncbi:alpha/beta fold hydrolase [Streptomyces sp. NPDC059783]|uniref:alpha/beta fold hydrolase n=1 Tax=Streptomyces sp. NPDC059783 TaxID=3346944 RepID=UPI00365E1912
MSGGGAHVPGTDGWARALTAWPERVVVRDGVRLVCRDSGGPGPAVLLLHGLAGHSGEWEALARLLGPGRRIVALDQRGHGASERRPGDVSRAAYVADVVAVIAELGLERPVVVGQSMGGHTALLTAAAHPEHVGALVLVEAAAGRTDPATPREIGEWLDTWPKPFPSYEDAVRFHGGGALGEGWAAGLEERNGGWWPRFDRDVMVASITELTRRAVWEEWEAVRCPALLVLGQSGILPPAAADAMRGRRPRTRAVCVPGAGHDVHLERPEALYAVIAAFLDADGSEGSHSSEGSDG